MYQSRKIPISLKEIKDYIGKCFLLETDEIATLDQQYQGEFIFLWNCFYRTNFMMDNIFITKFGVWCIFVSSWSFISHLLIQNKPPLFHSPTQKSNLHKLIYNISKLEEKVYWTIKDFAMNIVTIMKQLIVKNSVF